VSLRVGSLFSGVGGFDLGLERTGGFRTAWFCEQNSFSTYDPDTCSWRTSAPSSLTDESGEFSGTWPRSGMTRSGTAFQLRPSAPLTHGIASGCWPTPVADDTGHRKKPYSQGGRALSYMVGGPTNPTWIEWLLGFPMGWTDVAPSATRSSLPSRSTSGGASSTTKRKKDG
jgi:hypothetical protein